MTQTTSKAPRKYGNIYFDKMEAPINCWPELTEVELTDRNGTKRIVEIPTVEIWVAGDFVARRYASTPYWRIERWLRANGYPLYNVKWIGVKNSPKIEVEGYDN
jgi:hypothetical protein